MTTVRPAAGGNMHDPTKPHHIIMKSCTPANYRIEILCHVGGTSGKGRAWCSACSNAW